MTSPRVSVILPVYNREHFIVQAVESVINQSFKDWELIIVDDKSDDETILRIEPFLSDKIKLLKNKNNEGVSACLNKAIKLSKGAFIARMDSDDISVVDRLEQQVEFLSNNEKIFICGANMKGLNTGRNFYYSSSHDQILTNLLFGSPIASPTVMFRKEIFNELLFNENFRLSEDYEFWSRALFKFKAYNLPKVLVFYRQHDKQLTINHNKEQIKIDSKIKISLFKKLNYDRVKYPDSFIRKILHPKVNYDTKEVHSHLSWLKDLKNINTKYKIFRSKYFDQKLKDWRSEVIHNVYFGKNPDISRKDRIKLLLLLRFSEIRCILNRKIQKKFYKHEIPGI
ncbi:glycosyltransferase [uncultured Christiangramia sp.]|uniref:glycosyltransferase family 2 protein n=1 Tax=uncultured Christiangramia sp. TaxID=503836 RepID=UPI0026139B64|nr:glycosyltransferase [uncultured Christiangramia sp.]